MVGLDRENLVQEVADLASTYLRQGVKIPNVESVSPDDRIRDIEDLLIRYFVITGIDRLNDEVNPTHEQQSPDVVPFVKKLPGRINRLKSTTEQRIEVKRGAIDGRIDWQETIQTRSRRGTIDRGLFACQRNNDYVEIAENEVLATLVERIHSTIADRFERAGDQSNDYQWLEGWTRPDNPLWVTIRRLHLDNPYLSKIQVSDRPVSGTTIEEVKRARSPLYRESAKLLERYQRYSRGEFTDEELSTLFNSLFVGPKGTEELFELYWGYKIVSAYENRTLVPITGRSNEIASWKDCEAEYRLYYRTSSVDPPAFHVPVRAANEEIEALDSSFPKENTFTQRYHFAVGRSADAKEEILGKTRVRRSLWSGEPDLLLTKRDRSTDELLEVFLGEVKYSDSSDPRTISDRAARGIDELTEYMELLRDSNGEYIARPDSPVVVKGGVFTPTFEPKKSTSGGIQIFTYGDDIDQLI